VLAAGLAALLVGAVALTIGCVVLTRRNWLHRYPTPAGWTSSSWAYFTAGWASVLLAQVGGLWLWWRAPRNPTGRWLWLAGASLGVWFVGTYWASPWGSILMLAVLVFRPALAMALLGWPTGRPTRLIRRWIVGIAIVAAVASVLIELTTAGQLPPHWPADPLAPFEVAWVGSTMLPAWAWAFQFAAAIALAAVAISRRARLPAGARDLMTPVTIAAVVVAASDIISAVVVTLAAELLYDTSRGQNTLLGTVNLAQNYAQVGVAAVGIVVAAGRRRRATTTAPRRLEIDLGRAAPLSCPDEALAHLVGDPTARVLHPQSDGAWLDEAGTPATLGRPGVVDTRILDGDGTTIAVLQTSQATAADASLLEMAAASLRTRLHNERAVAHAEARRRQLTRLQHTLLGQMDHARAQLERDLHDGAQQRLIGLTLAMRLSARNPDLATRAALREELLATRQVLVDLVAGEAPIALSGGLAAALRLLSSSSPVAVDLRVSGDLAPDDPLATTAWFVASEGLTNALKHSGADHIALDASVDPGAVTVRVRDDGCGGATRPRSITSRVQDAGGTIDLTSEPDRGTDLVVRFERPAIGAAS
jgi:signal transduction histidine kinase